MLSGLFNQPKYIPLRYAGGIIIELEVCQNLTDPIIIPDTADPLISAEPWLFYSSANTSTQWEINNVRVLGDVLTMDSQMEESFAAHMRTNGSLDISFNTYISQMQSIVGPDVSVNVQRSVSRLKSFL
jgi:hypothetical protein